MQLRITAEATPRTKQDFVYQILRRAIMRCELAPGQRLVIRDIADQLAVSPIPVRDALQALQSEGLVERSPHAGAIVSRISEGSVAEIFAIKEGLESVAARLVAEQAAEEDLRAITRLLEEMDGTLQAWEYERWAELNTRFHGAIASMTGMPMLEEMTRRVLDRWDRIRRYFFADVLAHRLASSQHEHHAIARAIRQHNAEEAESLTKAHNQNALRAYMDHLAASKGTDEEAEQTG